MSISPSMTMRFLARVFDYLLLFTVILFILGICDIYLTCTKLLILMAALPCIWLPIEAVCLSLFGTTPGKALLGICILDQKGHLLKLPQAWTRSVLTAWLSIVFFIPGINLYLIYHFLKRRKNLFKWEILTHSKTVCKTGRLRKYLTLALFLSLIAGVYFQDDLIGKFSFSNPLSFFSQAEKKWVKFTSPDGKFTAYFPKQPNHQLQHILIPRGHGELAYDELSCMNDEKEIYSLSYATLPSEILKWKASLVLKGILRIVSSDASPGKIVKQHYSKIQHPALDYCLRHQNGMETRGRLILIGNSLYKLEIKFTKETSNLEALEQALSTFINSFVPLA
jgi:hypothetical protein